ncbi:hypothetical protein F5B19DRAFT_453568 [Rostrohypoxylon terebratum]|nr:hypothetical protein F5B19DRAFT_453568 [Rostrohypoxylon terebratum]
MRIFDDESRQYDHVALTIHAKQAPRLLGGNTATLEQRIVGSFKTSENAYYLLGIFRHIGKCIPPPPSPTFSYLATYRFY